MSRFAGHGIAQCAEDSNHGADSQVLLLATIAGRDSGASVLANIINSIDGHHLRSFAASAGWAHLAEFTRKWLTMREKMTQADHPDHTYFRQFRKSDRDGFPASSPDSDFRSISELIRRRIKPAWYQLFNLTKVMCGVRNLLIRAISPTRSTRVFGFLHAFSDHEEESATRGDEGRVSDYKDKGATASMMLASLDLFLALFPRGRVILHLPFTELPNSTLGQPRCACKPTAQCRTTPEWAEHREHMQRQLLRFHEHRPNRTLLVDASREFSNMSQFVHRVMHFLDEPSTHHTEARGSRSLVSWTSRLQRDGILTLRRSAMPRNQSLQERLRCHIDHPRGANAVWMCPHSRCARQKAATAGDLPPRLEVKAICTMCTTTLGEWGWREWSLGESDMESMRAAQTKERTPL